MAKYLSQLIQKLDDFKVIGEKSIRITGVKDNSRQVKKGDLFIAIKGETYDAHGFIPDVIRKGAVAVVGTVKPKRSWLRNVAYIKVSNSREALSLIASAWCDNPSKKLKLIGVTGTDGKTTTASIIYHLLTSNKKKVGLITSVNAKIGNKEFDTGFHVTNPEPLELQKFLKRMVDEGCEYAVLEVTSHGLEQERVAGIDFDLAVLTNITREHLDYHKTYKNYFGSKSRLFRLAKEAVVLNKDDESYKKIKAITSRNTKTISYGIDAKDADYFAENITERVNGSNFSVVSKAGSFKVGIRLIGGYNISNTLAAVVVAKFYKLKDKGIVQGLKSFKGIEGRLEEVRNKKGIRIIIDFAHTPNSLESILKLLRKQTKGRLISVFGCAGERDVEKRKIMPAISVKHADVSVFTAEDPRSEDVNKILSVMKNSAKSAGGRKYSEDTNNKSYISFSERGDAITNAINNIAQPKDTVVILGKGHENSMCYSGIEYPWSDKKAVALALKGKVLIIKRK